MQVVNHSCIKKFALLLFMLRWSCTDQIDFELASINLLKISLLQLYFTIFVLTSKALWKLLPKKNSMMVSHFQFVQLIKPMQRETKFSKSSEKSISSIIDTISFFVFPCLQNKSCTYQIKETTRLCQENHIEIFCDLLSIASIDELIVVYIDT